MARVNLISCLRVSITASKPVSPYSGYTGQLRSSVYQPTELALITKAVANVSKRPQQQLIVWNFPTEQRLFENHECLQP